MPSSKQPKTVYVQGFYMKRQIQRMFEQRGFNNVTSPADAEFVVWTGGSDINPSMYKQKPIPGTIFDTHLDTQDSMLFLQSEHAYRIGICRGGQLLNVLNGGSMWQDADNHNDGDIHQAYDLITQEWIPLNSLHHQCMIVPRTHGEILAYTKVASYKENYLCCWTKDADQSNDPYEADIEAAWYPETRSLCFQPHPEFEDVGTRKYFFELLERYCA